MGEGSAIEWTDHTFNPWWGCTKVSPGCAHCYAETFDHRLGGDHWGPGKPRRTFGDKHWTEPIKWNAAAVAAGRRARVFCASMADVFDEEAPEGALDRLWGLIRATPMLSWQLLTKRPERILENLPPDWGMGFRNVWLGTTVEDQKRANERVPVLLQVPARVRFVSCEPLLGPVSLRWIPWQGRVLDALGGWWGDPGEWRDRARRLDWVIVGGESGHGARPMVADWARSLRNQCDSVCAFHFKQWGEHDANGRRVGRKAAGRVLDGRLHDEFPSSLEVGG